VDRALQAANVAPAAIGRVFLTGGTERFGAAKLSGGGEFVSVADGLARMGQRAWLVT